MADEHQRINSEGEFYQDRKGNTHSHVNRHTETVRNHRPDEYRDGYVHGLATEHRLQEERQVVRDNNNAARGLLLGIILTSLVGLGAGLAYYFSQQTQDPTPASDPAPVIVPNTQPRGTDAPPPERTVIERETTIERPTFIPVPQPQTTVAPAPQPNINIQQPADPPAPQSNVNIQLPPVAPAPQVNDNNTTGETQQAPALQTPATSPTNTNTNASDAGSETATPDNTGATNQ